MTPEIKRACIHRLEATIVNGHALDYPQAAHDAALALAELHHFQADSEFLREEKAFAWGRVTSDAHLTPRWKILVGALLLMYAALTLPLVVRLLLTAVA